MRKYGDAKVKLSNVERWFVSSLQNNRDAESTVRLTVATGQQFVGLVRAVSVANDIVVLDGDQWQSTVPISSIVAIERAWNRDR